ncbi:MAG: helix-turn-helix domain-containing protein, partial [Ktedonobacteraceae bacterium]
MGKLSRMSDVDRNTIKRMFDDPRYSPTVETLWKVAKALKVTPMTSWRKCPIHNLELLTRQENNQLLRALLLMLLEPLLQRVRMHPPHILKQHRWLAI